MYPLQPPAQEQQGRPTPEPREREPPVPPVWGLGQEPTALQGPEREQGPARKGHPAKPALVQAGWKMFQAIP